MSITFQPELSELISRGASAELVLDAQRYLSGQCVDEVLKKIDREVRNGTMTAELALACVHEIAAYRRIVSRQEQQITSGRAAAARLAQEASNG